MIHKTDAGQAASPASCVYWEIFRRLERLLTQLFLRTEVRRRSDRRQKLDNHVRKTAIFFPNNPAWTVLHAINIPDHEEVRSLVIIAIPDLSRAVIDEHVAAREEVGLSPPALADTVSKQVDLVSSKPWAAQRSASFGTWKRPHGCAAVRPIIIPSRCALRRIS